MVPPTSKEVLASPMSTFRTMVPVFAPMLSAASITPAGTSFREDSTILPTNGAAASVRGTMVAVEP